MRKASFHRFVYRAGRPLVIPFLRSKFNYTYDRLPPITTPFFLLSNHNTDYDPIFLGAASPQQMYFVATEKILRMGLLSAFVMRLFQPIIHYKGKTGVSSVKEILQKLRDGHNVALFPEGNRSFNGLTGSFSEATGKLAKRSGAALVTYRLRGGYLTTPRWGKGIRKGRVRGELVHIYTPEELKTMSVSAVNEAIRQDLFVDAYADQLRERIAYVGKDPAVGLESTVFVCPGCGRFSALHSAGDRIRCSHCGFQADYDAYGYLNAADGRTFTVTELDALQRAALRELLEASGPEVLFHDAVTEELIGSRHEVVSKRSAELTATKNGLTVSGRELPFSCITGMAINQRNLLIIHFTPGDGHVELSGPVSFNALKYLYLYQEYENRLESDEKI